MALTGYYAWHKICVDRGILPGMQELVRRIGDDERRHMAWGTFTCRRHVAADDANWTVFETRMNELMPLALRNTEEAFALYDDDIPFDLTMDEFMQYASDKGMRRFGTISSARGRPLGEIDLDYSPLQLEDTFADEDRRPSQRLRNRPAGFSPGELVAVGEHQGAAIEHHRPASGRVGEMFTPDVDRLRLHLAEILNDDAKAFRVRARLEADTAVYRQLRSAAFIPFTCRFVGHRTPENHQQLTRKSVNHARRLTASE